MHKKILLAGGSGLIGSYLGRTLREKGYSPAVLTRSPSEKAEFPEYKWDPSKAYVDPAALENCLAVINLAGANIAEKRWSKSRKKVLMESRIRSTQCLVSAINAAGQKPELLISGSASGYYGDRGEMMLHEDIEKGSGFMPDLCAAWEEAAKSVNARLVIMRIGIVLSDKGGFLKEVARPVKWGIGAALGSGKQYVPWIHIDDLAEAFLHVLEKKDCSGIYNACAPNPVSNKLITKQIAKALKRPLILPAVPEFFLRIFFGELTDALLMSNRCSATRLQQSGFRFRFTESGEAINDLTSPPSPLSGGEG